MKSEPSVEEHFFARAAESVLAKILARYVMPAVVSIAVAITSWLVPQWIEELQRNTEIRLAAMERRLDATEEEQRLRSQSVEKITETLSAVQAALAGIQATSIAQYNEVQKDLQRHDYLIDRKKDR